MIDRLMKHNSNNKKCLIITGCIAPMKQDNLMISNAKVRLNQYLDSIEFYLNHSNAKIIIFCENSNYEYDYSWLKELANSKGKDFEWISFKGDATLIKKQGKGAGEGEIIEYAIRHTQFKFDNIEKVTGRLIVKNISNIEMKIDYKNVYFNKDLHLFVNENAMDTRLFFCRRDILENKILALYKKTNDKDSNIEKLIARSINHIKCLPRYPIIVGKSAGFGFEYGEESFIRKRALNTLCILRIFNKKLFIRCVRKMCSLLKMW